MCCSETKLPLVVIVGPTAVGKTEIAIQLAKQLNGEIISADSRLFYRGLDIGTAKPKPEERGAVPHFLIDVAEPDETWSLALFQRAARQAILSINERGHMPFLVGGTGQFITSVIEEWSIPAQKPDHRLRSILEKWAADIGENGLHRRLATLDPVSAQRIDPRNVRRTIRALEVCLMTGKRFSEQRQKSISPYQFLVLGITRDRVDLYKRIDNRIDDMIDQGFVDEVKAFIDKGYSMDLPAFSAIGYREIVDYLGGKSTFNEAIVLIKRGTHQYVRRQANWFRLDDPDIHWFKAGPNAIELMEKAITSFYGLQG